MPREMFTQALAPAVRRPRSRWTIVGSLVAHLGAITIIVVVPIVSGAAGPEVATRLKGFVVVATPPPVPPTPAAASPTARQLPPEIKLDAAPLSPAQGPPQEPEIAARGMGDPVPGALPMVGAGVPTGLFSRSSGTTIGPPPIPKEPLRIGGDIKPPRRLAYAPPVYPAIAQQTHVEGTVILEAVIDETGAVRDVRVLRSIPVLDRAAIDAVSRWRYTPTRLNGLAVPILMTVTVTFSLR